MAAGDRGNTGITALSLRRLTLFKALQDIYNVANFLGIGANAVSASKLNTARTINGVSFDGQNNIDNYTTSDTAAATAAKEASKTGFVKAAGAAIAIKFTNTNSASNPTLNVNSTGAEAIYFNNAPTTDLVAGVIYQMIFDGTNYVIVGAGAVYADFIAATAQAAGTHGLVPAPPANSGSDKYLNATGNWTVPPDTTYSNFVSATSGASGTAGLVPAPPANTTATSYLDASGNWSIPYTTFTASTAQTAGVDGLVPGPAAGYGSGRYLDATGAWSIPPDTTYSNFVPATSNSAGTAGLVPAPSAGSDDEMYLTANATWKIPTNYHKTAHTYAKGEIVHVSSFPSNYCLECTTAGTTASTRAAINTYLNS